MILEGFEIENWACIKKLSVTGLPARGVIVLHGPNRTGKSSLVQALRACLFDYQSTSTAAALKKFFPRGSGEKPTVTVTFSAGGTTYRIQKCFGSNKSELAGRTPTGAWKVETTSAAEAHDRVCKCVGGEDSNSGLRQLLWLTQAEFRLPEPKKFDADVQAQLRGILGILQTQLDDRFIERVKKRWNIWYSGQRKADKKPQIKDGCKLAENLAKLSDAQEELSQSEEKFREIEALLRQVTTLETQRADLQRQLDDQTRALQKCQQERELSQGRIAARSLAETQHCNAETEQVAALNEKQQRTDAANRLVEAEKAVAPAQEKFDLAAGDVKSAEQKCGKLRNDVVGLRDERRKLETRANRVASKLAALTVVTSLEAAKKEFEHAKTIDNEIKEIEKDLDDNPAPDEEALQQLKDNRNKTSQLRAELNASAISLSLIPETNAAEAELTIDDGPLGKVQFADEPFTQPVRRKAALRIVGWGQVEIRRGTGLGDLDQIERDLQDFETKFADAVTPFGVSAADPKALDLLLERAGKHRLRLPEMERKKKELIKLAPKGLNPLHTKVIELETKLADFTSSDPADSDPLPTAQGELDALAKTLKEQIDDKDSEIKSLETQIENLDTSIAVLREKETTAREGLATCKAAEKTRREELDRLRSEELIAQRVATAKLALDKAQTTLAQTELTAEESTIEQRLSECDEAVKALDKQIRENEGKYNTIKGRLEESEGLHSRRSALAARVDELTQLTVRESLEKDAIDRLYELFEECREKQLGTLMGPIHDRVLNWMRVLDIGDYNEVRFSDAFLPDKLIRRDGTAEFAIDEESTGAQEQIGMLTRLALGSLLTSFNEPTVAILDDPLTHCDVGRLNKMRAILRRAAEGDAKQTPPAGPLQIIVLTCHPEWFRDKDATVIDLENADVMQRFPG